MINHLLSIFVCCSLFLSGWQTGEPNCSHCCPKCFRCGVEEQKCDRHNIKLVQNGIYYCNRDYTTSAKSGKCPKCGNKLQKMDCEKNAAKKSKEKDEDKK